MLATAGWQLQADFGAAHHSLCTTSAAACCYWCESQGLDLGFACISDLVKYRHLLQYQVESGGSSGPTYTFWLPAIDQPMHFGYYSCNGFSSNVKPNAPERQDATYL